jgi:carbamate kinase
MGSHIKVVIALGGNALMEEDMPPTAQAQYEVVKNTSEIIADIKNVFGYEMAIVHGNGPQVGNIVLASEYAAAVTPPMPLDVCTAMSQGYIGFQLQQGLRHALTSRGIRLPVVTLVTQVAVDPKDPAFQNPAKPIGPFYTEDEAKDLMAKKGYAMHEDAGRGWRRVVASPLPKRIIEIHSIRELWDSTIVIAAGGGGIPVVEKKDGTLEGIPAVIDKDLAAEKLAEEVEADILLILTAVEKVCINFKKPDQKELSFMSVEDCERYIAEGQFAPGSMLPKIQAAVAFAKSSPANKTVITSLDRAVEALKGNTGTVIMQE